MRVSFFLSLDGAVVSSLRSVWPALRFFLPPCTYGERANMWGNSFNTHTQFTGYHACPHSLIGALSVRLVLLAGLVGCADLHAVSAVTIRALDPVHQSPARMQATDNKSLGVSFS